MPLTLPTELNALLATKNAKAHTTLDILFGGDGPIKHLSTVALEDVPTNIFGVIDYENTFRTSSSLGQSLTVSVDRVDIAIQNADLVMGTAIVNNPTYLNGAKGILSVVFINAPSIQVEILHGQISNASSEDNELKCQLVSYLSLSGPVGGWRPLMRHCAWRFKRAGCDSTDSSSTCSHVFDDPNGCSSKAPAARLNTPEPDNNQDSFGGYIYRSPIIVGSTITDPQGAVDGGNDFSTYVRNREGWEGRHVIPSEHYSFSWHE